MNNVDVTKNPKKKKPKWFKPKPFVVEIELPKLENGELDTQLLPVSKTSGSAAYDLFVNDDVVYVRPGRFTVVDTGIKMKIPPNYVGLMAPRSGLARDHSISIINTPSVIDSDYRGIVKILLINHGTEDVKLQKYDRVAQIMFMPIKKGEMKPVEVLSTDNFKNERGDGGFGSTGMK